MWTATRRTRRLGRHRVTRRARRSHAARASTLARRPRKRGPRAAPVAGHPGDLDAPARRRVGDDGGSERGEFSCSIAATRARLPCRGASSRRPAARNAARGSLMRVAAARSRSYAARAGGAPRRAARASFAASDCRARQQPRARACSVTAVAFQSGDFGDRYESLVGTLGPDVRHSCVLFTDHTGKKSVLGKVRGRSGAMSRDVYARDARETSRADAFCLRRRERRRERRRRRRRPVRAVCVRARVSASDASATNGEGSGSRAVAARVGVNGTARAAARPNGEPASVSRGALMRHPGAVTAAAARGLGNGPGAAGNRRRPGDGRERLRGRCVDAHALPERLGGELVAASVGEGRLFRGERSAGGRVAARGAGGDTGGSHRGGIDAATPPPRSRSSESASRVGRDPPPSFLMPVTRFTSRPNFPIAERARDRHGGSQSRHVQTLSWIRVPAG